MSEQEPVSEQPMSGVRFVRFAVALLCSHGIASYAGARAIISWLLIGRLDFRFVAIAAAGVVIGCLAGYRQLVDQPTGRRLLYGTTTVVLWFVVNYALVNFAVDSNIPVATLGALSAMGTFWLPWIVIGPCFVRQRVFVAGLISGGICSAYYTGTIDITGLTGDTLVEVAWQRRGSPPSGVLDQQGDSISRLGSAKWPGYLGPGRAGAVSDGVLDGDWVQNPPQEVWRVACGSGWSSFAATETTLFSQEQIDAVDCVVARSVKDGSLLWLRGESGLGFKSGVGGDGPRATPTLHQIESDADTRQLVLFSVGPQGTVMCLDAADGSIQWQAELTEMFPGANLEHGVCASPLVSGDNVLFCPACPDGPCVVALRIADGEPAWQCDCDWRASYASPQLMTLAGVPQVVLHAGPGVISVDPASGKVNWQFAWSNEWDNNATQPLPVAGNKDDLIIATGYQGGAVRLAVAVDEAGLLQVTEQWKTTTTLRTKFCNMTQFEDVLVSLDSGILVGVDVSSGKRLWKRGRYGHGQLIVAGEHLIVVGEKGGVHLLQPSGDGPNECGHVEALDRKTWNHPAIVGDLLIVRNDVEIVCLRLPVHKAIVPTGSETPGGDHSETL